MKIRCPKCKIETDVVPTILECPICHAQLQELEIVETNGNTLKHLLDKVYCRLAPSPIHGVGVFAIRTIPKGVNPMEEVRHTEFVETPSREIFEDQSLSPAIVKLIKDMCPEDDEVLAFPDYSLNEIGVSFYLNHSDSPNMEENDGDFFALRDIDSGEELTVNYGTYGKLNL